MSVLAAGLVCISAALVLLGFRRRLEAAGRDPVAKAYRLFCRKLALAGIQRAPSQGPRDFARQVGVLRADLKRPVNEIVRRYIDLTYAERGGGEAARAFVREVKRFHPKKAA